MTTDDIRSKSDGRYELMLEVTRKTLEEDPDLLLCEGLRLIEDEEHTRVVGQRVSPHEPPTARLRSIGNLHVEHMLADR